MKIIKQKNIPKILFFTKDREIKYAAGITKKGKNEIRYLSVGTLTKRVAVKKDIITKLKNKFLKRLFSFKTIATPIKLIKKSRGVIP